MRRSDSPCYRLSVRARISAGLSFSTIVVMLTASTGREIVTEAHRSGMVLPLVTDPAAAVCAAELLAKAVLQLLGATSANPYR